MISISEKGLRGKAEIYLDHLEHAREGEVRPGEKRRGEGGRKGDTPGTHGNTVYVRNRPVTLVGNL